MESAHPLAVFLRDLCETVKNNIRQMFFQIVLAEAGVVTNVPCIGLEGGGGVLI